MRCHPAQRLKQEETVLCASAASFSGERVPRWVVLDHALRAFRFALSVRTVACKFDGATAMEQIIAHRSKADAFLPDNSLARPLGRIASRLLTHRRNLLPLQSKLLRHSSGVTIAFQTVGSCLLPRPRCLASQKGPKWYELGSDLPTLLDLHACTLSLLHSRSTDIRYCFRLRCTWTYLMLQQALYHTATR